MNIQSSTVLQRRFKNISNGIFVALFIGILACVGVLSIARVDIPISVDAKNLLNGGTAQAIESVYDDKNIIKTLSTNVWAALQYVLLKEGNKGVVIGKNGWLFTSEEFYAPEQYEVNLQSNINFIQDVDAVLQHAGVYLYVLVVPAKTEVYSEFLSRRTPSVAMQTIYSGLEKRLSVTQLVQAKEALIQAKKEASVFLQADTHWSPYGATVVAQQLAERILAKHDLSAYAKSFSVIKEELNDFNGDLTQFVPVGETFKFLLGMPTSLEVARAVNDEDDLFADEHFPVNLVGTSYSANEQWGFLDALKIKLGVDVVNFAQEGVGPMLPMLDYLESDDFVSFPPKVVIWEIPERYLPIEYNMEERLSEVKVKLDSMNIIANNAVDL